MTFHCFCFGLGYTAQALASLLVPQGWQVSGTHRNSFHTTLPASITHLLLSIPPESEGDIVLKHYREAIRQLPKLEWIGYLSTTGVYGDTQGGWVDETSPVNPPNTRSHYRVMAEQEWLAEPLPVHIFRLSGIYGKGRSALDNIQNGTARRIDKPHQYFSRIHVEDIARVLLASILQPHPGAFYNLADDFPCPQEEVVRFAAELLGVEPPPLVPFEQAELSDMARSFYGSSRRVKNGKIKEELGVVLHYPSYREGLRALLNI